MEIELNESEYRLLNKINLAIEGTLSGTLSAYGLDYLAVCPSCGYDDFNHKSGCPFDTAEEVLVRGVTYIKVQDPDDNCEGCAGLNKKKVECYELPPCSLAIWKEKP